MLLTKVVLGRVRQVNAWNEAMTLPAGYNSVSVTANLFSNSTNVTTTFRSFSIARADL